MKKLGFFSVYINRDAKAFKIYKELCKQYDIDFDNSWSGNTVYYGTNSRNKSHCDDKSFGDKIFVSVETFKSFLENESEDYEIF